MNINGAHVATHATAIATAVAVIYAVYATKDARCLWAFLIPACLETKTRVLVNGKEVKSDESEPSEKD